MAVTVLDTNVIFALRSAYDQYHEQAVKIMTAMDRGELPTGRVTNYVLAETLSLVGERIGHDTATETLDFLIEGAGFEIVQTSKSDFNAGQALFRQHPGLTFVDAITAAYLQREEIEYIYSFDNDFDAVEDIIRLDTASNPCN
jgi:uncharacterized protein